VADEASVLMADAKGAFCDAGNADSAKKCAVRALSLADIEGARPDIEGLGYEQVLIAVKTTALFHHDRLQVILQTWGSEDSVKEHPMRLIFTSDKEEQIQVPYSYTLCTVLH
jgi:hypothetical protein